MQRATSHHGIWTHKSSYQQYPRGFNRSGSETETRLMPSEMYYLPLGRILVRQPVYEWRIPRDRSWKTGPSWIARKEWSELKTGFRSCRTSDTCKTFTLAEITMLPRIVIRLVQGLFEHVSQFRPENRWQIANWIQMRTDCHKLTIAQGRRYSIQKRLPRIRI